MDILKDYEHRPLPSPRLQLIEPVERYARDVGLTEPRWLKLRTGGHNQHNPQFARAIGRREGSALVKMLAGNARLPNQVVAEVFERADGVPLFVSCTNGIAHETGSKSATARFPSPLSQKP
jgi:hypothetical protein